MNDVVERLGWTLVHSVWQLLAVALIAALVDREMRRRSASARYIAGVISLGAVFALPCLTWSLIVVEPHDTTWRAGSVSPSVLETSLDPEVTEGLTPDGTQAVSGKALAAGHSPGIVDPELPVASAIPLKASVIGLTPPARQDSEDVGFGTESQPTAWQRWLTSLRAVIEPRLSLLVAVWVVGVVLCSLRPVWGLWTQWRLRRVGLSPVPEAVQRTLSELARRMGLARIVRIAESTLVRVPMVVGYLRPMILLPASVLTGLAPSQLEALLAHELAHVRRHDWLVNALQVLAETLFFFHPAVWWLSKRIRNERELCCDDIALSLINDKAVFARTLLILEELRQTTVVTALAATDGDLVQRVSRLMPTANSNGQAPNRSNFGATVAAMLAVGMAFMLAFGSLAKSGATGVEGSSVPPKQPTEVAVPSDDVGSSAAVGATQNLPEVKKCRVTFANADSSTAKAAVVLSQLRRNVVGGGNQFASEYLPVLQKTTHRLDAEGNYEITLLPDADMFRVDVFPAWPNGDSNTDSSLGVAVTKSNEFEKFDAIELPPLRVISGRVVRPDGEPAANARVTGSLIRSVGGHTQWVFVETKTAADGTFRVMAPNNYRVGAGVPGLLWIVPDDYCPLGVDVRWNQNDLGTLTLTAGERQRGRVLDTDGTPVAGIQVRAFRMDSDSQVIRDFEDKYRTHGNRRMAVTNDEGDFELPPLEAGQFQVGFAESAVSQKQPLNLKGIFATRVLQLDPSAEPIELRALPAAEIHLRSVNQQGQPQRGPEFWITGKIEDQHFGARGHVRDDGSCVVRVPREMQNIDLRIQPGETESFRIRHSAERFRWSWGCRLTAESLDSDVTEFEFTRYDAPVLIVKAVDEANQTVPDVLTELIYSNSLDGNGIENVDRKILDDGRIQSTSLRTDEDVTVIVSKEGWTAKHQKLRLAEGERRELVVVMQPEVGEHAGRGESISRFGLE